MDFLVAAHSGLRWIVLLALLGAILFAAQNRNADSWPGGAIKPFLFTAIVFDLQVTLGIVLYLAGQGWEKNLFLAVIHPLIMLAALGAWHMFVAKARKAAAPSSYRTLLLGGVVSLALVIAAIPWAS